MRARKSRRSRAFLLIEALFAMFLIFTGALIIAATMPLANVSRNKAQLADKAMDIAQKQMEAIRAAGYPNATPGQLLSLGLIDSSSPVSTNTYTFTNSDSTNLDNPATVLPNGSGQIKLETLSIDMTRVTVKVSYTESGVTRSYTIGSLEANL